MNTPADGGTDSTEPDGYDYTRVNSIARIALYDDLLSAPRVTEIQPAPTGEFIETLASAIYEQAKDSGGTIPYTVIREVAENFIHAQFAEATVSILDHGNTIRFADQGPGIRFKDRVQLPGFTSAIEPMKSYIRGVGSGLPIVKEYLEFSHGTISIEDNLGTGAVVTISLVGNQAAQAQNRNQDEGGEEPEAGDADAAWPSEAAWPSMADAAGAAYRDTALGARGTGYPGGTVAPAGYQASHPLAAESAGAAGYALQPSAGAAIDPRALPYASQDAAGAYAAVPATQGSVPAAGYLPNQIAYRPYVPAQGAPVAAYPGYMPAAAQALPAQSVHVSGGMPSLTDRERTLLKYFLQANAPLGQTDVNRALGIAPATVSSDFAKLEAAGILVKIDRGKKRVLTDLGRYVASTL